MWLAMMHGCLLSRSLFYNNFVHTYPFLKIYFFHLMCKKQYLMLLIHDEHFRFAIHGDDPCGYRSFFMSKQLIPRIDPCKYHSDSCMIRFIGARPYGTGHMGGAQYTTVSGQVNIAHAPPMVRSIRNTTGSCSR